MLETQATRRVVKHGDLGFISLSQPNFINYHASSIGCVDINVTILILGVCIYYITVTNLINSLM
jgi:hypothetical protein